MRTARFGFAIITAAGLVWLVVAFDDAARDAWEALTAADPAAMLGAFAIFVVGRGVAGTAAFAVAARAVAGVPPAPAAMVSLRSSVGKYVPGSIWQPMSAVLGLRRAGATGPAAVSVVVVDMAASLVGALVAGAAAVPVLVARDGRTAAWLLLGVPALAVLHPRGFALVLRAIRRARGDTDAIALPSPRALPAVAAIHAAGWLVAGCSLVVVLAALDPDAALAAAIPAAALSWAAGFVVVVAPAGLGVREVVLALLLSGSTTTRAAVAAAVVSRLMFVVMDLLGALGAMAAGRSRSDVPA